MIPNLRDYQARAVEELYRWLALRNGNPCVVAPTGSGKSWIIAAICEDVLRRWPDTRRILVLSHVKELLKQDADKILRAWPDAPLGLYSAGLRSREIARITVAGVQSVFRRAAELGFVDLVVVDEAHLINSNDTGMYRRLLGGLAAVNPALRVVGLTATPYRLGQGLIAGERALFTPPLIEPVTIAELVARGYLAPLSSKLTEKRYDLEGARVVAGDYVEKDVIARVDDRRLNAAVAREIAARAEEGEIKRRSWLVFCSGIVHALHMRDALRAIGVAAETVTSKTPAEERAELLGAYVKGEITALTNANVLTTGFDAPDTDLIALCRATLSPGLYVQMAGRGMRPKSDGRAKNCLVLDFAGNVARHGPVTAVRPPEDTRRGAENETPEDRTKICPNCDEIISRETRVCPGCGYEWPPEEPKTVNFDLHPGDADIMGAEPVRTLKLRSWKWRVSKSRNGGIPMLVADLTAADLTEDSLRYYFCLMHGGWAARKGYERLRRVFGGMGATLPVLPPYAEGDLNNLAALLNETQPPESVEWKTNAKGYKEIESYTWNAPVRGEPEGMTEDGESAVELGHGGGVVRSA